MCCPTNVGVNFREAVLFTCLQPLLVLLHPQALPSHYPQHPAVTQAEDSHIKGGLKLQAQRRLRLHEEKLNYGRVADPGFWHDIDRHAIRGSDLPPVQLGVGEHHLDAAPQSRSQLSGHLPDVEVAAREGKGRFGREFVSEANLPT